MLLRMMGNNVAEIALTKLPAKVDIRKCSRHIAQPAVKMQPRAFVQPETSNKGLAGTDPAIEQATRTSNEQTSNEGLHGRTVTAKSTAVIKFPGKTIEHTTWHITNSHVKYCLERHRPKRDPLRQIFLICSLVLRTP